MPLTVSQRTRVWRLQLRGASLGGLRNIAVVTPFITRLFYREVIDGVESALIGAGCDLTLYRLKNNSEQRKVLFDCFLVRNGVDAAIALILFLSDDEVRRLRQLRNLCGGAEDSLPHVPPFFIHDVVMVKRGRSI